MRAFLFAVLLVSCTGISAQVYRCPQVYPDKDRPASPLTGAIMRQTEPTPINGLLDEEAAEEGYDSHYALDPVDQTWLVCFYGGKERIKGRFHDGHEWNQRIASADSAWKMKLAPKLSDCTIRTRESKTHAPNKSTWTVTVTCK
jgi:hypothetical protein